MCSLQKEQRGRSDFGSATAAEEDVWSGKEERLLIRERFSPGDLHNLRHGRTVNLPLPLAEPERPLVGTAEGPVPPEA